MANRQRSNFKYGILSAQVNSGAGTATSDAFANLPTITGGQRLALVFDPDGENGAPEIVWVNSHSPSSTTVSILRGQEGTTARTHPINTKWLHGPTAEDFGDGLADGLTLEANVNGNLAVKAAGIQTSHLANGAVTQDKLASAAVTGTKLANAAVTKEKIEASQQLPAGVIMPFAGPEGSVPAGWLLCDGRTVPTATYPDLYSVIGNTYGGDPTNFTLPDLRGRSLFGLDNMGGTAAGRIAGGTTLGGSGGASTHTLSTSELPAHTHAIDHNHATVNTSTDGSHSHTPNGGGTFVLQDRGNNNAGLSLTNGGEKVSTTNTAGAHNHTVDLPNFTGTSGSTGSGAAHNNMPPYVLLNYIIKA